MAASDAMVAAAVAGDQAALQQLMERCKPDLTRYARRLCESDDVEEAVQDALWLLYRRVGALRTVAAFSSWLFQVVRRACRRLARRRADFRSHGALDDFELVDNHGDNPELRLDLVNAMGRLEPRYRQILILRDISGASAEEAARELGIAVDASKSRLHRARLQMRALLGAEAGNVKGTGK